MDQTLADNLSSAVKPSSSGTAESVSVRIDTETADSWSRLLEGFGDATFYQTWTYGREHWGEGQLSHFVLTRDEAPVAAAQVRVVQVPALRAGIAYVRWGPLCERRGEPFDPAIAIEALQRMRAEYVVRRRLTLLVIPNAFAGTERAQALAAAFSATGFREVPDLPRYTTIVVPLVDSATMRKALDKKWRNQLTASERNELGFEATAGPAAFEEFRRLYYLMWQRKQFATSVEIREFARMAELGERMPVFLARKNGVAVAALVCSCVGDTAIYLLGATNETARTLKASYFLQWHAMQWLRDRGAVRYDLGGLDAEANPGGYHFKRGFGGREVQQLAAHACDGGWLSRGITYCATRGSRHPSTLAASPESRFQ